MYQLTGFVRFLLGMDKEKARRHWRDVHGPLGKVVPGIDRYVQNHFAPLPGDGRLSLEELPFDGYASLWFADKAACEAALQTPEWQLLVEDGDNFLEMPTIVSMEIEERVIKDGPRTPFKEICVVTFKAGMTKQEAGDYWTNVHGSLGVEVAPEMTRYTHNHVVEPLTAGGSGASPDFDGFAEHWFHDRDAYLRTVSSLGWELAREDGYNVFDMSVLWETAIEEYVIKE